MRAFLPSVASLILPTVSGISSTSSESSSYKFMLLPHSADGNIDTRLDNAADGISDALLDAAVDGINEALRDIDTFGARETRREWT